MAESEEELKHLWMKVNMKSEKVGLNLNIKKTKIMASGPITSWQIDGETVTDFTKAEDKDTNEDAAEKTGDETEEQPAEGSDADLTDEEPADEAHSERTQGRTREVRGHIFVHDTGDRICLRFFGELRKHDRCVWWELW